MTAVNTKTTTRTKALQREIAGQMKDLPLEELLALREFTVFLRQRSLREQSVASASILLRRPTVEMSADSLLGLMDILPPIGGDALTDSEALYDEL